MTLRRKIFIFLLIFVFVCINIIFPTWSQASYYFRQELKVEHGEVRIFLKNEQGDQLNGLSEEK